MVVTENSYLSQLEREISVVDTEKPKGVLTMGLQREFAYHAAQFHDQSRFFNRNRANTDYGGFPRPAATGRGEPHAKRVRLAHPVARSQNSSARALDRGI
jgi:hypothetical protein